MGAARTSRAHPRIRLQNGEGEEMTDRELLELAAKAAGIECRGWCPPGGRSDGWHGMYTGDGETGAWSQWNPLTDDGDALRLAVKLDMKVFHAAKSAYAIPSHDGVGMEVQDRYIDAGGDKYAATRRAIVRAAASIGQTADSIRQP
jgi:hypothetical protein